MFIPFGCMPLSPPQPSVAVDSDYSLIEITLKLEKKVNELTNIVTLQSEQIKDLDERVKALENPEIDLLFNE